MSRRLALIVVLAVLTGCGEDEPGSASGGSGGGGPLACTLGTLYPSASVIDPDNPVYTDEMYAQADVTDMFAQAKAESSPAYLSYAAARDHANLLGCAFCACGCASSIGHLSAIDCFKDLHGFT